MKIAVFGAIGDTGRQVVAYAAYAGHDVTAVVRRAGSDRIRVVMADVTRPNALGDTVRGQSAVISALGTRKKGAVSVCTDGVTAIVAAMRHTEVRRLVVVSVYDARETHDRSPPSDHGMSGIGTGPTAEVVTSRGGTR